MDIVCDIILYMNEKSGSKHRENEPLSFATIPPKSIRRIYYLEVLRVVACLAVVMIHASCVYLGKDMGSFNYWVGNVLDGMSRVAVPLFVMISGALMLDEKYAYKAEKLKKHIVKLAVFFVFWSAFYTLIFGIVVQAMKGEPINVLDIIVSLVKGHYHLWFIYLIIGLYLILPLLRLWVKKVNKKYVQYFIVLSMIFTFALPQIIQVGGYYNGGFGVFKELLENKIALYYVGGYTTYFLLGWYLNNFDLKKKKLIYCLGIIGAFVTIMGTYVLFVTTGRALQLYNNLGLNVLFMSIALFVFIRNRFSGAGVKERGMVKVVSKYSLGIYAIHALIVEVAYLALDRIGSSLAIINIPIVFVLAFSISLLLSFIASKIPLLKRLV